MILFVRFTSSNSSRFKPFVLMILQIVHLPHLDQTYKGFDNGFRCRLENVPIISFANAILKSRCANDFGNGPGCVSLYKM